MKTIYIFLLLNIWYFILFLFLSNRWIIKVFTQKGVADSPWPEPSPSIPTLSLVRCSNLKVLFFFLFLRKIFFFSFSFFEKGWESGNWKKERESLAGSLDIWNGTKMSICRREMTKRWISHVIIRGTCPRGHHSQSQVIGLMG